MPNTLSHIYKMYQIYENNWTQLYNKTIFYKKVQDCIQINTNKIILKTLWNALFTEDLFLLNLQVCRTASNSLMLATISREARTGSESISTHQRWAAYFADQSTRPWIGCAAGGRGINFGVLFVGELNDGCPRWGFTDFREL